MDDKWHILKPEKRPNYYVSIDEAKAHAIFTMRKNWAEGVYGFRNYEHYVLSENPMVIYDLNGTALFFGFDILNIPSSSNELLYKGLIFVSASKSIGTPIPQIQLYRRVWDPDFALNNIQEKIKIMYPNTDVRHAELVCYCYPKIGVRIKLDDSKRGVVEKIFDVSSFSEITKSGVWSFYKDIVSQNIGERLQRWDAYEKELALVRSDIPNLVNEQLGKDVLKKIKDSIKRTYRNNGIWQRFIASRYYNIERIIRYCPHCDTHKCFERHLQEKENYCAVATCQMILDFYRFYYAQDDIAYRMDMHDNDGLEIEDQLRCLRIFSNNCLVPDPDRNADWNTAVEEINANRPFKVGISNKRERHAKACFGYRIQNYWIPSPIPPRQLLILDPWPTLRPINSTEPWPEITNLCQGRRFTWEDYDVVNNRLNFVYVRHRTNPCP